MKFVGPPIFLCLLAVSVAGAGAPQSMPIWDSPEWRYTSTPSVYGNGSSVTTDGQLALRSLEHNGNSSYQWNYVIFSPDFKEGVFPNPKLRPYVITGGTWSFLASTFGPVFQDSGPVTAETIFTPLPGDLALDESIDSADAAILFEQWGTDGGNSRADITLDGIVDAADAGGLFEKWTGDSISALPEPSLPIGAMALAGLCLLRSPRVVVPVCNC